MRHYISCWLLGLLTCFACQPDDLELSALPEGQLLSEEAEEGCSDSNKYVDYSYLSNYVGYGYHPFVGTDYRFYNGCKPMIAMMDDDIYKSTVDVPLNVDVDVVSSTSALIDLASQEIPYTLNLDGVVLGIGDRQFADQQGGKDKVDMGEWMLDKVPTGDNIVSTLVRINIRHARYDVSDAPSLNPKAQGHIAQGELDYFFDRYGPTYVSAHITGAKLYCYFAFDFSGTSEISEQRRESMVRAYVGSTLKITGESNDISEEDATIVRRSFTGMGTASNGIRGYNIRLIESIDQVNEEIDRLQEHLTANPQSATTLEMSLRSYTSLTDNEQFRAEYDRRMQQECVEDYQTWRRLSFEMSRIYSKTDIKQLKTEAKQAVNRVIAIRKDVLACRGASDDPSSYQPLIAWWALEERSASLYRYYSEDRQNHYYTTDPESIKSVHGGDSYQLERVQCRVLMAPEEGTTWLKEYWYNQGDDHRYNSELLDQGENEAYRFVRDIGHIFKNNEDEAIDRDWLRPLYLYYNQERQDHLITTDPEDETFGTVKGGDGYRFLGTLGYAVWRGY